MPRKPRVPLPPTPPGETVEERAARMEVCITLSRRPTPPPLPNGDPGETDAAKKEREKKNRQSRHYWRSQKGTAKFKDKCKKGSKVIYLYIYIVCMYGVHCYTCRVITFRDSLKPYTYIYCRSFTIKGSTGRRRRIQPSTNTTWTRRESGGETKHMAHLVALVCTYISYQWVYIWSDNNACNSMLFHVIVITFTCCHLYNNYI